MPGSGSATLTVSAERPAPQRATGEAGHGAIGHLGAPPGQQDMGLGHRQALSQPSLYALFFAQEHLPGLAMPIGAHRTDGLANLAHQGFA